jgi:sulfatase maturation enzyme AslB (radical SAM superfamily)
MKTTEVLQAWRGILVGRKPSLSIEITKECPLRCPGCYAFDPAHLGGKSELRQLSDFKGDQLVRNILAIVDREKPLHLSLVGGDPLVRYREVELLLPQLEKRGIHTQIVTSAFRAIPIEWNRLTRLNIVVSIDGLQADHDERRKPATYERIPKNIAGTKVTIPLSRETLPPGPVIWRNFLSSGAVVRRSIKYGLASLRHSGAPSVRRFSLLSSDRLLWRIF